MRIHQFLLPLLLILSTSLPHALCGQSHDPFETQGHTYPAQVELQLGYGLLAQRFAPEIRNLGIRGNVAVLLKPGSTPGFRWGIFYQYQERSGKFDFYRLSPLWSGSIQQESYAVSTNHHSVGLQASILLNGAITSIFKRTLPPWLELYQTYFVAVTQINTTLPPEVESQEIVTGFRSDFGVSDFPRLGEDIRYGLGTTLGTRVHIPRTRLSLFGEFGIGPLQAINLGGVIRFN